MAKTMISIKLDSKIKKAAEDLGLSLSAVVNATLYEFARTRELHVGTALQPTPYLERILEQAERDFRKGKNLSPAFDNVEDAIRWLKA